MALRRSLSRAPRRVPVPPSLCLPPRSLLRLLVTATNTENAAKPDNLSPCGWDPAANPEPTGAPWLHQEVLPANTWSPERFQLSPKGNKPLLKPPRTWGKDSLPHVKGLPEQARKLHREALERGELTYDDPETGLRVSSALKHEKRGRCCGCLCRHCAYAPDLGELRDAFSRDGFVALPGIVGGPQTGELEATTALDTYRYVHDRVASGELLVPGRHDLAAPVRGSSDGTHGDNSERIAQIMWPTDVIGGPSREGPLHTRAFEIAKALLGDDMAFDFDMIITKWPNSATETPWHQDAAYWPSGGLTDSRSLSVWCALDDATEDNGALWFLKGSHKNDAKWESERGTGILPHAPGMGKDSHVLAAASPAAVNERSGLSRWEDHEDAVCVPLRAGSAVAWHGKTLHFAGGNAMAAARRAFIVVFRPASVVAWQREHGFDHMRKGLGDYEAQREAVAR
jgi:Phytanoyl-CoA dioxygenase (PhyH)/Family of unknown function (DUF5522)